MSLFRAEERQFAETVSRLVYSNPFLPERIELERAALGEEFQERGAHWNTQFGSGQKPPNVAQLVVRVGELLQTVRLRIERREVDVTETDRELYEDLLLLALFDGLGFGELGPGHPPEKPVAIYRQFQSRAAALLRVGDVELPLLRQLPHAFACFYQLHRAFQNIFHYIVGFSRAAVQLRAAVWQSIFTHDMRRYRRTMFERMGDFTTLITGPSGAGKELVARAISLSRYVPFDPKSGTFADESIELFFPLNLSALSPTVIESELFGHRRGSFTGADADRAGWLEICPVLGTVFLDEIGELNTAIQVKMLRVLQSRTFSRLGETAVRRFEGKIIAATNRDLAAMLPAGLCREDFYYRLCSDIIVVPSLAQRLADCPGELRQLIAHLVTRIVGEDAADVAREVEQVIDRQLGMDYTWPGNVRELEQCIRNVVVRKQYSPPKLVRHPSKDGLECSLAGDVANGSLTVDELLRRYCTLVYSQTGSFEATARRLKLDRRTVRAKVDRGLLE